ncbi:hypothetical protein PtA15_6A680 [Puccinia triticina]|uniref:Uncharacterized protein n=1 Tax=Puccinia triticina TaxID=208348 RepID=A0ABY7CLU1_9BASI|nr:uncharacterized protein PtA15_6A680 [Puccinia triticina]WAQ86050.1 hypothetical protein PtA15_6A680 [Puccinia triticina]WAR55944.1 hypothetical protein PtB15_6B688 [Puccinia triticina]
MSSQPDPHSPAGPPATATQLTPGPTRRARSPSNIAVGPKRAAGNGLVRQFLADLGGVTIVPDDLATDFNEMTKHNQNVVVLSTLRAVLSRLDSLTQAPTPLTGPQAPAAVDLPLAEQIRRFVFLSVDKVGPLAV